MPEQTKYMDFEQFAKTFAEFAVQHDTILGKHEFARRTNLIIGYPKANTETKTFLQQQIEYMQPGAEKQCFEQLLNAANDNSPEAKDLLKIATVVSSVESPEPLRLSAFLSAIQKGGLSDPNLSYKYLDVIKKVLRNTIDYQNGKADYGELLMETHRQLASHPLATVADKCGYGYAAPAQEKMALLTDAAKMVEAEIKQQQDDLVPDPTEIRRIVDTDAVKVINLAIDIYNRCPTGSPEQRQMQERIDIYKREFNIDNILKFGSGDYIGKFRDELMQELTETKEENHRLTKKVEDTRSELELQKQIAQRREENLDAELGRQGKTVELYKGIAQLAETKAQLAEAMANNIENEVLNIGMLMDNIDQTIKNSGGLPIKRLHELQEQVNALLDKFNASRKTIETNKEQYTINLNEQIRQFQERGGHL